MQLLWRKHKLINFLSFHKSFVIAAMLIVWVNFKEIQLDVALRAQINMVSPILPKRKVVLAQLFGYLEKTPEHIDYLRLSKPCFPYFFLVDSISECKVIIGAICVDLCPLYTQMDFYIISRVHCLGSTKWILETFLCSIVLSFFMF